MPESATPNMGLIMPSPGDDAGTWDDLINAAADAIDAHDHSSGSGVQVPTAGLNIDADLTFGGFSATEVKAVRFTQQATISAFTRGLAWKTSTNELYAIKSDGTEVRITNGSTLDVTAAAGFGGDYASSDALASFDQASGEYRFYSSDATTPDTWGKLSSEQINIHPAGTGSNRVQLKAPAGLAASYSVTYPAALPAATRRVSITSAGVMTYDGAHGAEELCLRWSSGHQSSGTWTPGTTTVASSAGGEIWDIPIPLPVGKRVTSIVIAYQRAGAGTLTFDFVRDDLTNSSGFTVVATTNIASGAGYANITISSINHTLLASNAYSLRFTTGAAADLIAGIIVAYDQP